MTNPRTDYPLPYPFAGGAPVAVLLVCVVALLIAATVPISVHIPVDGPVAHTEQGQTPPVEWQVAGAIDVRGDVIAYVLEGKSGALLVDANDPCGYVPVEIMDDECGPPTRGYIRLAALRNFQLRQMAFEQNCANPWLLVPGEGPCADTYIRLVLTYSTGEPRVVFDCSGWPCIPVGKDGCVGCTEFGGDFPLPTQAPGPTLIESDPVRGRCDCEEA